MKQLITFKDFREFFEEWVGDGICLTTHYRFTYSVLIDGVFETKCDLFSETLNIDEEYRVGNEEVKPHPEYENIIKNINDYFVHSVEVEEIRTIDDTNQNAYIRVFLCESAADIIGIEPKFNGNKYFNPTRFCDMIPLFDQNTLVDIFVLEFDEGKGISSNNPHWEYKDPNELPTGDNGYYFWYVQHIKTVIKEESGKPLADRPITQIFLTKDLQWVLLANPNVNV